MWILGIAGSHNGAVALIHDGRVVAAIQSERICRIKRRSIQIDPISVDAWHLARYCLDFASIRLEDIDAIATSSPRTVAFARFAIADEHALPRLITVPHHLAHAEYAVHYAPPEPAIVLVCDGSGTSEEQRAALDIKERERQPIKHIAGSGRESISAYAFDGERLELIYRIARDDTGYRLPGTGQRCLESVGHLWRWAAWYCCGDPTDAGKVMGLGPYGDPEGVRDLRYLSFNDATGDLRVSFDDLAALPRPNVERRDITGDPHYQDIAANLQAATNDLLLRLVHRLDKIHHAPRLCFSGGVALNGIANEHLIRSGSHHVHMNGSCEDNGTSIGAALSAYHHLTGERVSERVTDYYGSLYSDEEVERSLRARGFACRRLPDRALLGVTAAALAEGRIVGWFQGRSEFGPRALGNRSILADPSRDDMRDRLNFQIKRREAYRPYAPAVLEERAAEFFDLTGSSPCMLRVVPVKVGSLPAVTHVDASARVQTVSISDNSRFHALIDEFGRRTGIPVLLNTSFNMAGQPIVESPDDAIEAFITSGIDALAINGYFIERAQIRRLFCNAPPADWAGETAPEDLVFIPNPLRYLVWSAPEGAPPGEEIVYVYGLNAMVSLEKAAEPFVERLCQQRSFTVAECVRWHRDGDYSWDYVRGVLDLLRQHGLILRRPSTTPSLQASLRLRHSGGNGPEIRTGPWE